VQPGNRLASRLPALPYRVSHVVRAGSGEKVVGVEAAPVIAGVANIKPVRNWRLVGLKRKSMHVLGPSIKSYAPISVALNAALPLPASGFIIYMAAQE
jgi:hypothetical protein